MLRPAVGGVLFEFLHKQLGDLHRQLVHAVIIVAKAGEMAFDLKIHRDALLIADGAYPGVFDGAEGIRHDGQARDAKGHVAVHLRVVQGHLACLVGVFVVHEVDGVHGIHIQAGQFA